GAKPFQCSLCEKSYSQNDQLMIHMKIHSGEKPYSCRHCGNTFAKNCDLITHLKTHTGEEPYQCSYTCQVSSEVTLRNTDTCSGLQESINGSSIETIIQNNRVSTIERKCNSCQQDTNQIKQETFTTLPDTLVVQAKRFNAGISNQGFFNQKIMSDIKVDNEICETKEAIFSNQQNIHLVDMDSKEGVKVNRSYKSEKDCLSLNELNGRQLMNVEQSGELPYQCSDCALTFSKMSDLIVHLKTHNGDELYQCNHCNKAFSNSTDFTEHLITHSVNNIYKCRQC
ncbi:unnamed protein product, partial [Meganyctiphanes norvegica]